MSFGQNSTQPPWVVLVDAGGSKTAAALASVDSGRVTIRSRGQSGPGNPVAAGWQIGCRNWEEAIKTAGEGLGQFSQWRTDVSYVVLAAAGAGRPETASEALRWCAQQFPRATSAVLPDIAAVLAAVNADGAGIALVAGTGSLAWGVNRTGQVARCGGWGFFLGDEGGAAWIGREALVAVTKARDGLLSPTLLTHEILRTIGLPSPSELVNWVQNAWQQPRTIAALAQIVVKCASAGDEVAAEILNRGSDYLAQLAACVAHKLGWRPPDLSVALGGGLFVHVPAYREKVVQKLNERGWVPSSQLAEDPLLGAARIAENLLVTYKWRHWSFAAIYRPNHKSPQP
ncbi:MAG: hypothetical protein NZ899_00575 [Thermoguttaceae bacterium]|nr:hypothetical protein [Thermoguttaceae bacterium]MDW8077390.1 BadF/BadG/BcrA/BcrD ATPase family protein [Thermoguttaceae bacterium]